MPFYQPSVVRRFIAARDMRRARNALRSYERNCTTAHCEGRPLVIDPFAGLGSIPCDALRIGAEASPGIPDPAAVLLNRVDLRYRDVREGKFADVLCFGEGHPKLTSQEAAFTADHVEFCEDVLLVPHNKTTSNLAQ